MLKYVFTLFTVMVATAAFAQQASTVDPRLAPAAVNALQAMIALRDAEIKALQEDSSKRESDWAEYSKPLWQPPAQTSAIPDEKK